MDQDNAKRRSRAHAMYSGDFLGDDGHLHIFHALDVGLNLVVAILSHGGTSGHGVSPFQIAKGKKNDDLRNSVRS